jgi:hypothetical protein
LTAGIYSEKPTSFGQFNFSGLIEVCGSLRPSDGHTGSQLLLPGDYTQNPCSGHFECNGDFSPSPSVAPAKLIETYRVSIRSGVNQIALI